MWIHARLSKQISEDAVNTVVYLINKGSLVPLNYGIPEETWTEKEVNLNHFRTFVVSLMYMLN